ncbi:MASE1 domain-containing protein [Fulvivirga sp. 29W222]|uniref:histidine kinase n=1 Tax=Fulvivirga marina TaxID=2494733 RepID=A0A937FVA8_9BACT|nr:MASE1 domain-containing protein [Fulvivirga marina]MBL6444906.1 MASE1 domain-containing protein [Fulvivirga marina]
MNAISLKPFATLKKSNDLKIIVVSVLYYASAQFGLWLSFGETKTVPLWPPAGLALALLIILKHRTWPAITIGSLIAVALIFLHLGITFSFSVVMAMVVIAIGNTLEALFGYFLIRKFIKVRNPFLKTTHVFIFLLVALLMCTLGSGISMLSMWFNHIITSEAILSTFSSLWLSNVASVLIITPFVISWTANFKIEFNWHRIVEGIIFIAALALIVMSLQIDTISSTIEKSVPFLIMPFLLWLGFRFNLQTTMTGILIASLLAIYFTLHYEGPFVLDSEDNSRLILQVFIGVISISTIILYATVNERTVAQKAIEKFNEQLETKVKERTQELHDEIQVRKKIEEKTRISNSKLRKANIELDNFVYSVSHDLRAPIASVLGLVNLAKKEEDIIMMKKYLAMVAESAERQDTFIKDILDLSRNARLEVDSEKIEFEEMINEIFDQLKYSSGEKQILKDIYIKQDVPFNSDKKRLKVIFNNLISNAIRYSNHTDPYIKIDIAVNSVTAKININDNGRGIPKGHLKNVFKMFYRATDDNAGSGLGLYIVKETVDKLRGNVALNSVEKKGTTVNLEIPNLSDN